MNNFDDANSQKETSPSLIVDLITPYVDSNKIILHGSQEKQLYSELCRDLANALMADLVFVSEFLPPDGNEVVDACNLPDYYDVFGGNHENSQILNFSSDENVLIINDLKKISRIDNWVVQGLIKFEQRSLVVLPLMGVGKMGRVYISWRSSINNGWQTGQKLLVLLLRNFIGLSLANNYFARQIHLQDTQLSLWRATSEQVLPLLKSNQITRQQIIELIAKVFGYRYVSIWMIDDISKEIYVDSQVGFPNTVYHMRVKIGIKGVVGTAAAGITPIVVPDVSKCSFYIESSPSVKSELSIPLVYEDKVFAVFDLQSDRVEDFDEKTVEFMSVLASQLSTTINNAMLFEQKNEQETRLNTVLESISEPIFATDPQGKIIHANASFLKLLERGKEILGMNIESLDYELALLINQALSPSDESRVTILERRGRIYKPLINIPKLLNRSIGAVTLLHDVTRETEIDKMKNDLISHVSHDLRTPLTSLVGFASTSLRDMKRYVIPSIDSSNSKAQGATERILRDLMIMREEGDRLGELINNWLDIQKIEAGQFEWDLSRVSLPKVVEDAAERMMGMSNQKNIPIRFEIIDDIEVFADENGLMRVVINLLSNALKYSEKGEITVTVKKAQDSAFLEMNGMRSDRFGLVQIKDQGEGIPADKLSRIFEKFQRVSGHASKAQKGTGLGLAISKEIINAQGGEIWVESKNGLGSVFSFALPLYIVDAKREDRNEISSPTSNKELNGFTKKILVVDDDANIRRYIIAALDDLNCQFYEAGDGLLAVQLGRSINPDLVILDIQMEPLSGLDVLSIFGRDEKISNIPILVLTVKNIDKKFMDKAIELGAKTVLQKPIDNFQLENIVRSIIQ